MCFSRAPAPPPPPPPPAPPPAPPQASAQANMTARKAQQKKTKSKQGQAGTIKNVAGAQGLLDDAYTTTPTLLGS
jgi:hypothetical protein